MAGVAFHVGSGALCQKPYMAALLEARKIFDIAEALGLPPMTVLDIGGGFAGYDGEAPVTFAEVAAAVAPAIDSLFQPEIDVIAEPGRFVATGAFSFAARVVGVRERKGCVRDYYIGDGVYGAFKDAVLLNVQFECRLLFGDDRTGTKVTCNMRGPSNDPYDVVLRDAALPRMEVGDWVFFPNMGAYTHALSTAFGAIERPPIFYF